MSIAPSRIRRIFIAKPLRRFVAKPEAPERLPGGGREAREAAAHHLRDIVMAYAVLNLLLTVLDLYWWVVIVSVVLSWLVAFDVLNTRSQAAQTIWRAVEALTEPLLRPIRSVLPAVGGLDLSPLILLLGLQFLRDLIARGAGGLAFG